MQRNDVLSVFDEETGLLIYVIPLHRVPSDAELQRAVDEFMQKREAISQTS